MRRLVARRISSNFAYSGGVMSSSNDNDGRSAMSVAGPGVDLVSARLNRDTLIDLRTCMLYAFVGENDMCPSPFNSWTRNGTVTTTW